MNISYDMIFKPNVLNIFCDASTYGRSGCTTVCYGAIAVNQNQMIDSIYRINQYQTNNNAEIKAIGGAISLAIKYKEMFSEINIFSDSQVSLFGIRDRIFNWKLNGKELTGSVGPIKSQDVFIEIMNLIVQCNLHVNFYHQKGHVNLRKQKDLLNGIDVFVNSNNITNKLGYDFIRYISGWNNMVDNRTREILVTTDITRLRILEPVKMIPNSNYKATLREYKNIMEEK